MLGQMEREVYAHDPVSILGAGAAGLFAAARLAGAGRQVILYDHKKTPGLKLSLAAASGLNISNSLGTELFHEQYGKDAARFRGFLADATPGSFVQWIESFGIETYTGSGGKILAREGSAGKTDGTEIVFALRRYLTETGLCEFRFGWGFAGFSADGRVCAKTEDGVKMDLSRPTLLALGGASWPATGSDGKWTSFFGRAGIALEPLAPANCGFNTDNLCVPDPGLGRLPLKNVGVRFGENFARGDAMLTETGIEGGPVYAHASAVVSALTSDAAAREGFPVLHFDLCPDLDARTIASRLARPRNGASASNFLRKTLGFDAAKRELIRRTLGTDGASRLFSEPGLAKALPVACRSPRPMEEAISCSGGVSFGELDDNLMLKKVPGVFCAGEMIAWDAPTGGFLLTGCYATACRAVRGMGLYRD